MKQTRLGASRAQHDAVMARLRQQGRLAASGQTRLAPLSPLTGSKPRNQETALAVTPLNENVDLLRGVDPKSRDATLLRQARAMGWIGFNRDPIHFSKLGRWWLGKALETRSKFMGGNNALGALQKAWALQTKAGHHPVIDGGGPWTWSEQHKRIEIESKRLRKRYTALGLPSPAQPVEDLGTLRDREARAKYWMEREAGLPLNSANIRAALRTANSRHASYQFAKGAHAFSRKLPPHDKDQPRSKGNRDGTMQNWAKVAMNAQLRLSHSHQPSALELAVINDALSDPTLAKELDAPVLRLARQRRDELKALIPDQNR